MTSLETANSEQHVVKILGTGERASCKPLADVLRPVTVEQAGVRIERFTAIATLGTPLDITRQELRIEAFFRGQRREPRGARGARRS